MGKGVEKEESKLCVDFYQGECRFVASAIGFLLLLCKGKPLNFLFKFLPNYDFIVGVFPLHCSTADAGLCDSIL